MLSVLIPVYNFDVRQLVDQIDQQCSKANIEYEIICIDDKSSSTYRELNREVKSMPSVKYEELEQNVGRGQIRNVLAHKAQYSNLLLLDCDVMVTSENFIENYLQNIKAPVVIGGITYADKKPKDNALLLRWEYGRKREQKSVQERKSSQHVQFLASNLLIDKNIFLNFQVPKQITGYGHEDTWLGIQLKKQKTKVVHIENAVMHLGLDKVEDFLEKTKSGLFNLARLYENKYVGRQIRLIDIYVKIKNSGLLSLLFWYLEKRLPSIEANLKGSNPKLNLFDQWKLYWFIRIYKELNTRS
jgi:glycosyltransferase involved in cell wall biosynthesis